VRLDLNLAVLVLQDNAYGMIRWKQQADGFPDFGMSFGNPDFAAYARAFRAVGKQVETADGLIPALEGAFRTGGVHLIAVPVDYSENITVLINELRISARDREEGRSTASE
jgi:acetolactate synthase I/II/III large subunit